MDVKFSPEAHWEFSLIGFGSKVPRGKGLAISYLSN